MPIMPCQRQVCNAGDLDRGLLRVTQRKQPCRPSVMSGEQRRRVSDQLVRRERFAELLTASMAILARAQVAILRCTERAPCDAVACAIEACDRPLQPPNMGKGLPSQKPSRTISPVMRPSGHLCRAQPEPRDPWPLSPAQPRTTPRHPWPKRQKHRQSGCS